ncbi:MAG: hypothetical protein JJ919_13040 [Henriciella sp.]|nr:hypothetical protein [Henriciella sp.]
MSRAIPLGPLVFALTGFVLIGSSVYLSLSGKSEVTSVPAEMVEGSIALQEEVALLVYHDPLRARGSVDIVLGQSPFVSDRSAYSRDLPVVADASEPELNPEFVGVFGRGNSISALVIWEPGQSAQSHEVGDDTPWGKLISATSSKLVFEGDEGLRELKLF